MYISRITSYNVCYTKLLRFFDHLGRAVHWSNAECQLTIEHPQYAKAFPKAKELFYSILRKNNTRVFTDRNTEIYFGKRMAENTIKNIKWGGTD